MPSSPRKEVTAMDNEYIICFRVNFKYCVNLHYGVE